jgi:RNA ligase
MNEILEKYHNEGWLIKQTHPILPLTIWNYSRKCAWDKHWDSVTMSCRGLVVDDEGKIISRCLKKFFNYEELNPEDIPNEPFEVTEKMDGSYLAAFFYNGEWVICSRGSFTSEQAIKGIELFSKINHNLLNKNNTYIFEIIY